VIVRFVRVPTWQRANDTGGLSQGGTDTFRPAFNAPVRDVVAFPAPVIASVNGAALGGMQLAVACDLRVVAPNATFGVPREGWESS
jgi:enoyl-CoA hydratase/carnithine racemase